MKKTFHKVNKQLIKANAELEEGKNIQLNKKKIEQLQQTQKILDQQINSQIQEYEKLDQINQEYHKKE